MNERGRYCPALRLSADIWSSGATFFYIIHGKVLYIDRSVFQMNDSTCTVEIQIPNTPAVSKSLQSLIREMLQEMQ